MYRGSPYQLKEESGLVGLKRGLGVNGTSLPKYIILRRQCRGGRELLDKLFGRAMLVDKLSVVVTMCNYG